MELISLVDQLEDLLQWFPAQPEGTTRSLERLARRLLTGEHGAEWPEVSAAATALRDASPETAFRCGEALTAVLRARTSSGNHSPSSLVLATERPEISAVGAALEGDGYSLVRPTTMSELLTDLSRPDVELIIVDLQSPGFASIDWLLDHRSADPSERVPVLALFDAPAGTDAEGAASWSRGQLLAHGADQALLWPEDRYALRIAINALIRRFGRARESSVNDALTGLPTRAAFDTAYAQAVGLSRRSGVPASVALLDFDHFKAVNDNYGHVSGDEVLRRGCAIIRGRLRDSDVLVRWGGEELAAVFPATSATEARAALDDALALVGAEAFEAPDGRSFNVTFSAGVAEVELDESAESALARADERLYTAKDEGRARIVATSRPAEARPLQVLLAVTEPRDSRTMVSRLKAMGAVATVVRTAEKFRRLLGANRYDLVVLDLTLPGSGGTGLLAECRRQAPGTPFLVVGADRRSTAISAAFALGADDYLARPFRSREFLARVGRLVRRSAVPQSAGLHAPVSVLLVEDDPGLMRILKLSLAGGGWTLHLATSSADGLASAQTESVDLVLVDADLGDEHAADSVAADSVAADFVQALERMGLGAPIIVMAANDVRSRFPAGLVASHLRKPFDPLTLGQRLRGILARERDNAPEPNVDASEEQHSS